MFSINVLILQVKIVCWCYNLIFYLYFFPINKVWNQLPTENTINWYRFLLILMYVLLCTKFSGHFITLNVIRFSHLYDLYIWSHVIQNEIESRYRIFVFRPLRLIYIYFSFLQFPQTWCVLSLENFCFLDIWSYGCLSVIQNNVFMVVLSVCSHTSNLIIN